MNISVQADEAMTFFVSTFLELATLFVGVSFIVSAVNHFLPAEKVKGVLSGNRGYGAAISLGALTPFCSCSTLPMMVGLLRAKAEFGPVMAFLFTSPLVNPFIFSLFWVTFGAETTMLYTLFALLMAAACGAILQRFKFDRFIKEETFREVDCNEKKGCTLSASTCEPESSNTKTCGNSEKPGISSTIVLKLIKDAINQLSTMVPYMVIGVAIGAVLHGFVPAELLTALSNHSLVLMIPLSALVGVFLYVRASTMVPIAASLMAKGVSVGAVMSLTIAGAGASLPEMIMLKRLFHWPLLIAFIASVFFTACMTGAVIELFNSVGVSK